MYSGKILLMVKLPPANFIFDWKFISLVYPDSPIIIYAHMGG
jgi:hypothetical protein